MPSQDEIMQQILELVSKGAAMPLTPEIEACLHDRYYDWIIKTKDGVPDSPQEVWDGAAGADIKARFVLIGEGLAVTKESKPVINKSDCTEACAKVESESKCPHCPDKAF